MPELLEIGQSYTWDRAALFNTGALNLIEVLERVPGLTVFRSGWITSPQYVSYLGNPARVRVYWDGAEMIPLGYATSYPLDLAVVPIWAVQSMSLERGADELRVYLQSWTVTRTTTQSRIDIVTGDLGTNILRGYFGSRFQNGMGVQFGGQVYGTSSNVVWGGGTGSDLLARVGWAKGRWSIDGYAERTNGTRDPQQGTDIGIFRYDSLTGLIPGQNGYRSNAYLRGGVGRPDTGTWWAQVMLDDQRVSQQNNGDTARVRQSATAVIASAGLNGGPFKLSGSARREWITYGNADEYTGRASLVTGIAALTGYADYISGNGGITDIALRVTPLNFLAIEGAVGYRRAPAAQGGDGVSGRLSVGARLGRVWVTVGEVERDATVVPPLLAYDPYYKFADAGTATGPFLTVRGKVIQDLGVDIWAVRYTDPGYYRPHLQTRAELYLDTEWRSKFPSGHFGFHGAGGFEYRSDVLFPTAFNLETFNPDAIAAFHSNVLYLNLEVRILDATIYFIGTWAIEPRPWEMVPEYVQQAQVYTYGLRWNFWN